jgi:circadian clock protein KaiC
VEDIKDEPIFSIADSIICLHYETHGLHSERFLEVAKVRGSNYFSGKHPYIVTSDGLQVFARTKTPVHFETYDFDERRISSGVPELDEMMGGGLPAGSATMLAGGAGTGKTLLGLHFVMAAAHRGESSVIVSYQETPVQLVQIARSFGWDLPDLIRRGLIRYLYQSPVEIQPDIHLFEIHQAVQETGARLVMIDSLKDLEIATPDKTRYKDYIYSLVQGFKSKGVTMLMTNEIVELFGPFSLSEYGVSFIADNVVLLRYVEMAGRMSRAISVMKMRGSQHSKEICEFEITGGGLTLLAPIRAYSGVLTGMPRHSPGTERELVQTGHLNAP